MSDAIAATTDRSDERAREHEFNESPAVALSPRQRAIVGLIARGFADKQIAKELGITRRTVRTQLERIYRRHGIHSKPEAVALVARSIR